MSARVSQRDGDETKGLGRHERRVADARSDLGAAPGSFLRGGASASRPSQSSQHPVPLPPVLARLESRPFVGRAAALRRVSAVWEHLSRGHGGGVALAGEPGIGKTRLTARVAARAHADGAVVLHGRADEESISPYQPFVEALRQYAAHRPRLVEETQLPTATAEELASLIPELGAPPSAAAAMWPPGATARALAARALRRRRPAAAARRRGSAAATDPGRPPLGGPPDAVFASAARTPRCRIAFARGRDLQRP